MKRRIKAMAVTAAAAMLVLSSSASVLAAYSGWVEKSGKWYYYNQDGSKLLNGWVSYGDSWYWINSTGNMSTRRWIEYEGEMYYLNEDGTMAANRFQLYKKKTRYLGADGRAVRNSWVTDSREKWYYMDENCDLTIGLREIDGGMYYFDGSGVMAVNMTVNGYQLGPDGKAAVQPE